ncbi:MAG: hypothetical protein R2751_14035 [Bacteroidales bacterium]
MRETGFRMKGASDAHMKELVEFCNTLRYEIRLGLAFALLFSFRLPVQEEGDRIHLRLRGDGVEELVRQIGSKRVGACTTGRSGSRVALLHLRSGFGVPGGRTLRGVGKEADCILP